MGNKANAGYIKLEKTVFKAGERVFGEFCIRASQSLYAENVTIQIQGFEEVE
jgi:hypothetical protein